MDAISIENEIVSLFPDLHRYLHKDTKRMYKSMENRVLAVFPE